MPAISFQHQFLDALLSGAKQQTTRKQTDRIKVGDVCNIYIDPRTPLTYAHILGKVQITEVYVMRHPIGIFPTGQRCVREPEYVSYHTPRPNCDTCGTASKPEPIDSSPTYARVTIIPGKGVFKPRDPDEE